MICSADARAAMSRARRGTGKNLVDQYGRMAAMLAGRIGVESQLARSLMQGIVPLRVVAPSQALAGGGGA